VTGGQQPARAHILVSVQVTIVVQGPQVPGAGMPERIPVLGSKVSPVGNPVAVQLYTGVAEQPVAVNVIVYGMFSHAAG